MPELPSRLYVYWQDLMETGIETEVNWCLQQGDVYRYGRSPLNELAQSLNMLECIAVLSVMQARVIFKAVASKRQSVRRKTRAFMLSEFVDDGGNAIENGNSATNLKRNKIHWHEDKTGISVVVINEDHWQLFLDIFNQVGFSIRRVYVDVDMLPDMIKKSENTGWVGVSWRHSLILRKGKEHRFGLHKAVFSTPAVLKNTLPLSDMKVGLWLGNKPSVPELSDWDNELSAATDAELFGELVKRHNPDTVIDLMARPKGNHHLWGWAIVLTFGLMMASWQLYLMELNKQVEGVKYQQQQYLETYYPDVNWLSDPVKEIRGWLQKTPIDSNWSYYLQALKNYQLSVAGPYRRATGNDLLIDSMNWEAGSLIIEIRPEIDPESVIMADESSRHTITWVPQPPDRGQIVITPAASDSKLPARGE